MEEMTEEVVVTVAAAAAVTEADLGGSISKNTQFFLKGFCWMATTF